MFLVLVLVFQTVFMIKLMIHKWKITLFWEIKIHRRIFYRKHSIYWGIVDKNNNKLIGTCGFNHWNRHHNRVEVSYDLDYSYWGKGIMTRSLTEIFKFAHQDMYVNRIQATVAIDNFSSIKLLERLGLKKEGILKEYGILHDIKTDFYMYGSVK